MCNHYRQHPEAIQSWAEYIGWSLPNAYSEIEIDIWPRRKAPVARIRDGERIVDSMVWGVPLTMAGKREGTTRTSHVTNVRNLESPFWKSMLMRPEQRCLVPFTSFAEPKIGQGREEHWFAIPSRNVAAFAGIWRESDGVRVFAFLTCAPNALVAPLHPKAMPVILHEEDYMRWLTGDYDEACALAEPFPAQLMTVG